MAMSVKGVVGAVLGALAVAGMAQQPVFRTSSELVSVPVSVADGNRPVTGLRSADFELRDNGIPQTIALAVGAEAPVDLTIVVDSSGSVGPEIELFQRDVERLGELLRDEDRVRILTFDWWVHEALAWSAPSVVPATIPITSRGGTALNDAVAVGLMAGMVPGRRHVLAVLIGGPENSSVVDTSRVVELAARANVALFTYTLDPTRPTPRVVPEAMIAPRSPTSTRPLSAPLPSASGRTVVMSRPAVERALALEDAAQRTGGRPRDYKHSAFGSLQTLMEEFRSTYILYFRPSGPPEPGWRELDVKVTTPGGERYQVRARPGYWSAPGGSATDSTARVSGPVQAQDRERAISAPARMAAGRGGATREMVWDLLARYEAGEHPAVVADIVHLASVDDATALLRREGRRWVESAPAGGASRRRTVAAALALDVAARIFAPFRQSGTDADLPLELQDEQRSLIFWGADLLGQNVGVSAAERSWYLAAIAVLQGQRRFHPQMQDSREATRVLAQAIARVPDDARHRWADALVLEQRVLLRMPGPRSRPEDAQRAYDAAVARADNDLRAEIQLHRVSRFLTANFANEALGPIVEDARREAAKEALVRTAQAEDITADRFLVYMCRMFRARIHDRLDQRVEAEASYRTALEVYPGAHSATLSLATLLFLRGDEAGAERLVDGVLTSPGAEDPWRVYFLQDYRRLPMYIDHMRAALAAGR